MPIQGRRFEPSVLTYLAIMAVPSPITSVARFE
jgi:hypothetical protein